MSRVKTSNLLDSLRDNFGTKIVASDIKGYCAANDISYPTVARHLEPYKIGRGKWDLTISEARNQFEQQVSVTETEVVKQNLIPTKDDTFVKFGNFADIKKILQSRIFYPAFITGLSGNGIQTLDLIDSCGDAAAFCRSNILKYASRYDKKGSAKMDLKKIIHYAVLLYHFTTKDSESDEQGYETF